MYQQTNDNQKVTSTGDLILVVVLIAIIVFIKKIAAFLSTAPLGTLWMVLLAMGLVGSIYFIYKKRLCSYRYTIYFRDPPEDDLDQYGQRSKWPYPLGTVLFERMTGGKGRLYEALRPEDIVALLAPGESYSEKIGFFNMARLSVYSVRTAHTLVFRRKGKLFGIYFHPTADFLRYVNESPINVEVSIPETAEAPEAVQNKADE